MKELEPGVRSAAVLLILVVWFLTGTGGQVVGQSSRSSAPSVDRRIDRMNRQGEEYERDKLRGELEGKPATSRDRRRAQALATQVKQDFEGLQTGYNQIVLAMASKKALNYDSVLAAVAEINKCSSRLKGNLALPQPKNNQDKKVSSDVEAFSREQLEGSLLTLRKHIYSFVTNPLFEAPTVLDVVQAKKAGDDLESIIGLSESIGKSGEKLNKVNKATAGTKL